jgi:hypothetical protein
MTVEGVYTFTATVTGPDGIVYQDSVAIVVLNKNDVGVVLRGIWDAMKSKLLTNDIDGALEYFTYEVRDSYRSTFAQLGTAELNSILMSFEAFEVLTIYEQYATCGLVRTESGGVYAYPIIFIQDGYGIWRINGM